MLKIRMYTPHKPVVFFFSIFFILREYEGTHYTVNPSLAEHDMPVLANSIDPDQLASGEAN